MKTAPRIHETKRFASTDAKLADAFCRDAVDSFARRYRENSDETEVYVMHDNGNGHLMRTDGGDWVKADWNWETDDEGSPIVATVYGSH